MLGFFHLDKTLGKVDNSYFRTSIQSKAIHYALSLDYMTDFPFVSASFLTNRLPVITSDNQYIKLSC